MRDFLAREKIPFEEIRLFEKGQKLPDLDEARALVVMGGPMNVYEEEKHPFLKDEDRFIRQAMQHGIPYLGICLGSQLLAKALNARVTKAAQPEVGWGEVKLTAAAANSLLFKNFPKSTLKVLQWHEDTFELPAGSAHLASNFIVPNQAFAYRDKAFGLQFHLEVNRTLLDDWFKNHPDRGKILAEFDRYQPELSRLADTLYQNFFK